MSQQINLYDAALERKRDWLALGNVVVGGMLLAVAVGVMGMVARSTLPALTAQSTTGEVQVKTLREQVAVMSQRAASRKADPRLEQELAAGHQLLAIRSEVLTTLRDSVGPNAQSYAEYLRGFARQTVSGLWLTGFSVKAAGSGMEIRGNTTDPALIPEYIRRLNRETAFRGMAFAALKLERPKANSATGTADATKATGAPASTPAWHEFILTPTLEGRTSPVQADNRSAAPAAPRLAATTAGGAG